MNTASKSSLFPSELWMAAHSERTHRAPCFHRPAHAAILINVLHYFPQWDLVNLCSPLNQSLSKTNVAAIQHRVTTELMRTERIEKLVLHTDKDIGAMLLVVIRGVVVCRFQKKRSVESIDLAPV